MKKKWSLLIGLSLLLLLLAACGSDDTGSDSGETSESNGAEDPGTIIYGGASWLAHIPAYIAVEQGFFEEEGLDVEFQSFSTSSERMTSLAAGDVHFASTGAISALSLMAAGNESFKIVGSPDVYVGQEGLVVAEGIESFDDLVGSQIAVPFSSSAHVMVLDLLEVNGLEPGTDVEVINMDGSDMVSSFTTGEIDAGAVWVPAFTLLQEVEGSSVLALDTDTSIYENYGFNGGPDVLVMQADFIEEYPETTEKMLDAYFRAIDWIIENPGETAEIFVELSNISVEEQEEIINSIEWLDESAQTDILGEDGDLTNTLTFLAEFLYENELTNQEVDDVMKWIDTDVFTE